MLLSKRHTALRSLSPRTAFQVFSLPELLSLPHRLLVLHGPNVLGEIESPETLRNGRHPGLVGGRVGTWFNLEPQSQATDA